MVFFTHPIKTDFSFGFISGIITTLRLMTSLLTQKREKQGINLEHLTIVLIVVILSHLIGDLINLYFK